MREIKFRAYLKKHDCIVDVEIMDWNEKYIVYEDLNSNFYDVTAIDVPDPECVTNFEDCELMQYTGLKDKNGKEIYKDDIIKCTAHFEKSPRTFIAVVEFDQGMFGVRWNDNAGKEMLKLTAFEREVLGNKHENPELLSHAE